MLQLVYEGGCYLLPASRPSLPAPDTRSPPIATSFLPSTFPYASLPVVPLRNHEESVHSFSFASKGPATDSRGQMQTVQRSQSLVLPKTSIVIEVPDLIHANLSTSLDLCLNSKPGEGSANEKQTLQAGAEAIRLRGRVSAFQES